MRPIEDSTLELWGQGGRHIQLLELGRVGLAHLDRMTQGSLGEAELL